MKSPEKIISEIVIEAQAFAVETRTTVQEAFFALSVKKIFERLNDLERKIDERK